MELGCFSRIRSCTNLSTINQYVVPPNLSATRNYQVLFVRF